MECSAVASLREIENWAEGKMPPKQAGTEDSCSEGLTEHHQERNAVSDVCGFQKGIKNDTFIHDYICLSTL